MDYKSLPRYSLGFFPTPIVECRRLSESLGGPRILMKRDDQTGLAMGGNKTRKLEILLAQAIAEGCDALITGGAEQSNHCRQTAAAAAMAGLECHLVLGGQAPELANGNLLLDQILKAQIHWTGEFRKGEKIPEIAEQLRSQGKKPYVIPYGASNALGAVGFIEAVHEVTAQLSEMDKSISHIVFASSSGGTQAGLAFGKVLFRGTFDVVGIAIDKGEAGDGPYDEHVLRLVHATAERLEVDCSLTVSDLIVRNEYLGRGYGVVGDAERGAIQRVAQTEGILLDPVYTGRAMAGLIDMIERGQFTNDDTVLFWHTGGTPSLFPYAPDLS